MIKYVLVERSLVVEKSFSGCDGLSNKKKRLKGLFGHWGNCYCVVFFAEMLGEACLAVFFSSPCFLWNNAALKYKKNQSILLR